MRKHVLNLLIREVDLVYGVSPVLQGNVIAVDVRGKEDFRVPHEALGRRQVGDEPGRAIRRPNVDNGGLLLGESRAQKTWTAAVERHGLCLALCLTAGRGGW